MKCNRWPRAWGGFVALFLSIAGLAQIAGAAPLTASGRDCTASVDSATGNYTVTAGPQHWAFNGSLGVALQNVGQQSGSDRIGQYQSLMFDWQSAGALSGEIRVYAARPVVLFVMSTHEAQPTPTDAFPTLSIPQNVKTMSYAEKVFSPHAFRGEANATPWLWFDSNGTAAILSPASNYMVAAMLPDGKSSASEAASDTVPWTGSTTKPTRKAAEKNIEPKTVGSGFVSTLHKLPADFTHETILAFGDSIHSTWDAWGTALTDLTSKHRPGYDADVFLKYLGYWTDNGAGYYYNYDLSKGYTATLLAVRDELRRLGIPLHYMQLDSWWYIKTNISPNGKVGAVSKNPKLPAGSWNCYGGLTAYVAHKDLFPNGLSAFQNQLGMPLITHNRWVDLNSPYRQQYTISGVAAIDPKFWQHIIGYIHTCGVAGYEQDWLNEIYRYSPELQSTTTAGDAFTDGMAHACAADGLSMQYCMELPRFYLQGTRYSNLTSVRVSDDHFMPKRWESFLYTSQLAAALGEWPFADCFRSNELGNLLLSDLSAGPIGLADLIGETNVRNLQRVIRADGVICKPDAPIVPIDAMYEADAKAGNGEKLPMIAAAHTDHGSLRTAYVFAFPRSGGESAELRIRPADFGIAGDAWLYRCANENDDAPRDGVHIAAGDTWSMHIPHPQAEKHWEYFVIATATPSGVALVGDQDKFVAAAHQRISEMAATDNGESAAVTFAPGERTVTLVGFAASAPTAAASTGHCDAVQYDAATRKFSVVVSGGADGTAKVEIRAGR